MTAEKVAKKLNSTILSKIELREGVTFDSFSFEKLPHLNKLVSFDAAAISIFGLSQINRKQIIPESEALIFNSGII